MLLANGSHLVCRYAEAQMAQEDAAVAQAAAALDTASSNEIQECFQTLAAALGGAVQAEFGLPVA